ncbi:MAG: M23 family metallopeptidase [Ruminiclostridium sp.]|nr:M23 family metallopeptidase [Ruminiclostridium sp.]
MLKISLQIKITSRKDITMEKIKEFFKDKGYIAGLVFAVIALVIAGWLAYDMTVKDVENTPPANTLSPVDNNVSDLPKKEETSEQTEESSGDDTEDVNNFINITAERVMPVDGEVINPYSNGELVKSETLGVWKTHDGIDISAEKGTEVKSASGGKVIAVRDDPLWGICVIIDHFDGYEGHYYGLDKALSVKEQTVVDAGQVIGRTGDCDCESKLAPHLHFAVKCNEKWIDPAEFLK